MAITPLPTPPSRSTPSTFSALADAFLGAFPTLVSEINAVVLAMNLNSLTSTSSTEVAIGTGSKTLTVEASKSYVVGMGVKIASTADGTKWMYGDVTAYNSGTGELTVTVTQTQGTGTIDAWTVTFAMVNGSLLTQSPQAIGFKLSGGTTSKELTVSADMALTGYASAAEINAGTETDKAIAPDQLKASAPTVAGLTDSSLTAHLPVFADPNKKIVSRDIAAVVNLKPVVNAAANKLDIFTKSGGADPDASNAIVVAIPDGNGVTMRSRAAAYLSGTSQIIMADATDYWGRASVARERRKAHLYAIWDGTGIVWALGGYSGFLKVPETTTATDDDYFLLEDGSTYTRSAAHDCVAVADILYTYNTAVAPDNTILAGNYAGSLVTNWNPKSDYGKLLTLATTNTSADDIALYSAVSAVVKQTGYYYINVTGYGRCAGAGAAQTAIYIYTGNAAIGSADLLALNLAQNQGGDEGIGISAQAIGYLAAGETIHLGAAVSGASGNRLLRGDDVSTGITSLRFQIL